MLEAIALGTGPSFFEWLKKERPNIPLFGCGVCPHYLKLDYYCWGDERHSRSVPRDGTHVFATFNVWEAGMTKWESFDPHGGSSGGMAVSAACQKFEHIGLVGFDGFKSDSDNWEYYDNFVLGFNNLIDYWTRRNKKLYSLMDKSIFNTKLLKYE